MATQVQSAWPAPTVSHLPAERHERNAPTQGPPSLIDLVNGDPSGGSSTTPCAVAGYPAITVPMGYTRNNMLPAGLQLLGRAFDEERLIKLAYSYEQATKWRRAPGSTPPLK